MAFMYSFVFQGIIDWYGAYISLLTPNIVLDHEILYLVTVSILKLLLARVEKIAL